MSTRPIAHVAAVPRHSDCWHSPAAEGRERSGDHSFPARREAPICAGNAYQPIKRIWPEQGKIVTEPFPSGGTGARGSRFADANLNAEDDRDKAASRSPVRARREAIGSRASRVQRRNPVRARGGRRGRHRRADGSSLSSPVRVAGHAGDRGGPFQELGPSAAGAGSAVCGRRRLHGWPLRRSAAPGEAAAGRSRDAAETLALTSATPRR